ncbi:ATP-binding protein [Kitasatospora sp. NPDC059571]|uniref:ATP-binding protein n=1 Tax=Kitasatospora sp. NPDC059571 TaxID=3346871 RepID=UPI0036C3BE82
MFLAPVIFQRPVSGDAEVLAMVSPGGAGSARHDAGRVSRRWTFMVEPCAAAVPQARRDVAAILKVWGVGLDPDLSYTVELVVTELVTNAVVHAGWATPRIAVTVEARADGGLGVGVGDNDPGRPSAGTAPMEATGGRGLAIIEVLLAELGGDIVTRRDAGGGKTVWVHVPAAGHLAKRAA